MVLGLGPGTRDETLLTRRLPSLRLEEAAPVDATRCESPYPLRDHGSRQRLTRPSADRDTPP
jgi:hypothetical protein